MTHSQSEPPRDPLAGRRFAYARAAAEDGAWDEAIDLLVQTLELAPDWTAAWVALGEAEARRGATAEALAAYRQALTLDPSDRHGAALKCAALDPAARPAEAPAAYIRTLFDEYAPRFDAHLTGPLGYRGPAGLRAALAEFGLRQFGHVIDLGCGTGLCGAEFRASCARLTGIDLSARMIEAARTKGLYDRLGVANIQNFLEDEPAESAGLVIAADVFVYIGDLTLVLRATARVLEPGGTLAFTAQRCAEGIEVGEDLRFAHSQETIAALTAHAGFRTLALQDYSTRREKGRDVPGLLYIGTR